MKFYESHFEEYITSVEKYNLHTELQPLFNKLPKKINQLENLIIYGPSGVGKYSQTLSILKRYSPSELKYDKKITINTEKQQYIYRISDIHYEVDMSQLGCNSKIVWHEIFFQIVDIISVKQEKIGIIVCKNFHLIHAELLEIFYSYMQQYNTLQTTIKIKFFILTEQLSFLPSPILNTCQILRVKRPEKEKYMELTTYTNSIDVPNKTFLQRVSFSKQGRKNNFVDEKIKTIFQNIDMDGVMNIKETKSFPLLGGMEDVPKDVFNIICDTIIQEIMNPKSISFTSFRDVLYDILTYNLDMTECLWYILRYFIDSNHLSKEDISDILIKSYSFLKYYNNNYRPIYHLESIMFYIINKIHKFNEL
jgi:ABC-type dipeptide/oligopeptide/nickel transport system ATPase component